MVVAVIPKYISSAFHHGNRDVYRFLLKNVKKFYIIEKDSDNKITDIKRVIRVKHLA
jgi:hypothetical protein